MWQLWRSHAVLWARGATHSQQLTSLIAPVNSRALCTAAQRQDVEREQLHYDVAVVGGGPSGLSAAIRLKQVTLVSTVQDFLSFAM